jgi:ADP-ribose pyrophosphatase YjhB (NUDIX family)
MPPKKGFLCPRCGADIPAHVNPVLTVDIIIEMDERSIVLIRRRNPPFGWALPGGFVDYGESLEDAAVREAREETSLEVSGLRQMHTYSKPDRDPRQHTITTVFTAKATGQPRASDDAADIGIFTRHNLPAPLVFDHRDILEDYFRSVDRASSDEETTAGGKR